MLPACAHSIYSPSTSPSLCHTHMQCESHTSPMARYRLPSLSEDSEDSEQKEPAEEEEEEESSLSRVSTSLFKQVGVLFYLSIVVPKKPRNQLLWLSWLIGVRQRNMTVYNCIYVWLFSVPLTLWHHYRCCTSLLRVRGSARQERSGGEYLLQCWRHSLHCTLLLIVLVISSGSWEWPRSYASLHWLLEF